MLASDIHGILSEDAALAALIDRIEPVRTSHLGNALLYELTPLTDDRITATWRCKITIIADTLERAYSADARVRELLLTNADRPLTRDILQVAVNGGGALYDDNRRKHHIITYYYIACRSTAGL